MKLISEACVDFVYDVVFPRKAVNWDQLLICLDIQGLSRLTTFPSTGNLPTLIFNRKTFENLIRNLKQQQHPAQIFTCENLHKTLKFALAYIYIPVAKVEKPCGANLYMQIFQPNKKKPDAV